MIHRMVPVTDTCRTEHAWVARRSQAVERKKNVVLLLDDVTSSCMHVQAVTTTAGLP